MKSGGRFQFTPLYGLKQRPTQRGVSPCRSVVFDEIQFWSGNVSALKTDPSISSKVSVFMRKDPKGKATAHWAQNKLKNENK